jgi:ATP-dependent DNA helicase DinG
LQAALTTVPDRLDTPVYAQGQLPKPALIDAFAQDESASLFATMGFWQGIDVPGRTLSLVVVDRLPFPRPDDPLLQARRDLVGRGKAFGAVDLPRATTLLAQGAGRLIRTATDRGVVAVLDSRLAKAGYRWDIVNALPPMKRTRHREEAEAFLREIAAEQR